MAIQLRHCSNSEVTVYAAFEMTYKLKCSIFRLLRIHLIYMQAPCVRRQLIHLHVWWSCGKLYALTTTDQTDSNNRNLNWETSHGLIVLFHSSTYRMKTHLLPWPCQLPNIIWAKQLHHSYHSRLPWTCQERKCFCLWVWNHPWSTH
jgi:hypothetical protein